MYIVYKAYDDNTAELLDICTYRRIEMTEIELIRFVQNGNEALGLSVSKSNNKINYINAYTFCQFPTEAEANEYIKINGLNYSNKKYINDMFCVLHRNNKVYHVDYYVYYMAGPELTYLSEKGGITPYIQGAKTFDKKEAGKKAALMRQKSKTGKYWTTQRVVVE